MRVVVSVTTHDTRDQFSYIAQCDDHTQSAILEHINMHISAADNDTASFKEL